jgi:hypothetical protein
MVSDTPETDAQVTTFSSISKLKKRFECSTGKVSAEFARKLERERNEARALLAEMQQAVKWARDEAKEWLQSRSETK